MTKPAPQQKTGSGDQRYRREPRARVKDDREHTHDGGVIAVVEMKDIEPHVDEVRQRHPRISDFQAEIVRLLIHTGWDAAKIARHMKVDAQRVRYHYEKEHVAAFRQELAMASLGWDAVLAQSTLRSLLHDKSSYVRLEAAKDLVSRAGLSMERARAGAVAVQLNFNTSAPLAQPEPRGGVVQDEGVQPPRLLRSSAVDAE